MLKPISANEFFVRFLDTGLDESTENMISFCVDNIMIDIINNIFEIKISQNYDFNIRKYVKAMNKTKFTIEIYEGNCYPDYINLLILDNCQLISHQQRFNYSNKDSAYNFLSIKFENSRELTNENQGGC